MTSFVAAIEMILYIHVTLLLTMKDWDTYGTEFKEKCLKG